MWDLIVTLFVGLIVGLIALPYIDFNREGNGYYTFAQRKFDAVGEDAGAVATRAAPSIVGGTGSRRARGPYRPRVGPPPASPQLSIVETAAIGPRRPGHASPQRLG